MAMWLRTSTGDAVRMAVMPRGMSSRPPKVSDSKTVGFPSKLSP